MSEHTEEDLVEEHRPKMGDIALSPPSPRAHVISAGHVFQSVGLLFSLGACCFWAFSTHLVEPADQPASRWTEYLSGDRLPAAVLTIGVVTTLVGGIGLVAVGVGLHGERRGSGRTAVALTAVMAAIYWGAGILLIIKTASWSYSLAPALFALATTGLFTLAVHSAAVLSRFPPPPDQNVVTDEFLKDHLERRRSG